MSRRRSSERSSIGLGVRRGDVSASWGSGGIDQTLAVTRVGRAVKAGRRPPVGEALTARSSTPGRMVGQARQGLGVAPSRVFGWTRALVVSSSPRAVEDKQAELGCLVMSSPGPVAGSEHGAIRRGQQCSITYAGPLGVMPILRAGLLAAS